MNAPTIIMPDADVVDPLRVSVREKWQGAVGDYSGFVSVPFVLLKKQHQLGLTATDLVVLINLLAHWWDPQVGVFPRSSIIAQRMGVNERTVHRSIDKMVKRGLIERYRENGLRKFQFTVLAKTLSKFVGAAGD